MGSNLCEQCTGACCKYVALPIDVPEDRRDFDDIRWYLMHENMTVFVEGGEWYVQFGSPCRNLGPDNRCLIYETRPKICREYKAGACDYEGTDHEYEQFFTRPEHIEAYAAKLLDKPRTKRPARGKRRPKVATNAAM